MKNRKSLSAGDELSDINISPLIDMVFILLIFFIVTTVFIEESGFEVEKPGSGGAAIALGEKPKAIMFHIDANSRVIYEGQDVGISGVRSVVRQGLQREKIPVVVSVDPDVQSGIVVRVMDEGRLGGADKITLATERR